MNNNEEDRAIGTGFRLNNAEDVLTEKWYSLGELSRNQAEYTVEKFITELEAMETPTYLDISCCIYQPSPESNRRIVAPLCRCLSNLRRQNKDELLRKITIFSVDNDDGMMEVFEQFLNAAKKCGIRHLKLEMVSFLPVQCLVQFCRDNNSTKVLELNYVAFGDRVLSLLPLTDSRPSPSSHDTSVRFLPQGKLVLEHVAFETSCDATMFMDFLAHVNLLVLELGYLDVSRPRLANVQIEPHEDDDDLIQAERIISEFIFPSVDTLTLMRSCRIEHFRAALDAGRASVTELSVFIIHGGEYEMASFSSKTKLEVLASFIPMASRMRSLAIVAYGPPNEVAPHRIQLLQAIEACATVTTIQMEDDDDGQPMFVPDDLNQMLKIASRNRKLARFVANPSQYPMRKLPALMCRFTNCPSGRYMLTRRLPEVIMFHHIIESTRKRKSIS